MDKAAEALGKRAWLPRALRNIFRNQEAIDHSLLKSVSKLTEADKALSRRINKFSSLDDLLAENYKLKRELALLKKPIPCYDNDGMRIVAHNMSWMSEEKFVCADKRGMDSGHKINRQKGSKDDIHIEWRVHIAIWAATHALKLQGDFVECGVNTGIISLAICDYLKFDDHDEKNFYLFDTYEGIPESQMPDAKREYFMATNDEFYEDCYEQAKANFKEFSNVYLVRGKVPETLSDVSISGVAYLHLDMNNVYPEIAAMEYF